MQEDHRRKFLFCAGGLLAAPLASFAQSAQKVRRIGFLSPDAESGYGQPTRQIFTASLRGLGYEEGKNLVIEWRWGDAKVETLPALAEELVRLNVELIVARTNDPIAAAKRSTRSIPIVMFNGNYPVEVGFIDSLARPGGNVTGTSFSSTEVIEKQIQMLHEVAPGAIRVAILWARRSGSEATERALAESLERAAARSGMKLQYFAVSRPEEVSAAKDRITGSRTDALWVSGLPLVRPYHQEIAAFALKQKLVAVGSIPTFADSGGLLAYSPDPQQSIDRTASYVDRILKGAHPADLPVEQPTRFNLVINLKTAKALGIKIPPTLLVRADRVIE